MSLLDELRDATGRVLTQAGPGVVRIGRGPGRGAGIVVGPGLVLTSAHNLRGEGSTVTFADGRPADATVKGVDLDGDLAVLAVDTGAAAQVEWGSAPDAPGTTVFALALPLGIGGLRVTSGTVSSLGRSFRGPRDRLISEAVEHTAPLGRGSSGGPLLDAEGRLVGINTHRTGDGLYLAIPVTDALRERVGALGRGETPTRRRLGVGLAPPHVARRLRAAVGLEPRDGVLVREVAEDSPAAAELRRGDLIVAAAGQPVGSIDALLDALDRVGDDQTLIVTVVRGNDEVQLTVRFDG
jgi:serine protease Do